MRPLSSYVSFGVRVSLGFQQTSQVSQNFRQFPEMVSESISSSHRHITKCHGIGLYESVGVNPRDADHMDLTVKLLNCPGHVNINILIQMTCSLLW